MKFIFPNEHSIFLHDTPSQELFRADERTFSSGCIRVENALQFAAVLLEGQDDWNAGKIQQAVDGAKTETVFLKSAAPRAHCLLDRQRRRFGGSALRSRRLQPGRRRASRAESCHSGRDQVMAARD